MAKSMVSGGDLPTAAAAPFAAQGSAPEAPLSWCPSRSGGCLRPHGKARVPGVHWEPTPPKKGFHGIDVGYEWTSRGFKLHFNEIQTGTKCESSSKPPIYGILFISRIMVSIGSMMIDIDNEERLRGS